MRKKLSVVCIIVLCLGLFPLATLVPQAHASTAIIDCIADTYTNVDMPDVNFGELETISTHSNDTVIRIVYLKFSLSVFEGIAITGAQLHIYSDTQSATPTTQAWGISAEWAEMGLKWNNQPGLAVLNDQKNTSGTGWHTFDVSNAVISAQNFVVGIALVTSTSIQSEYNNWRSRECAFGKPYITVDYLGSLPLPTPTPTATPTPTPTPTPTATPSYNGTDSTMSGNSTGYWDIEEYGHWKIWNDKNYQEGFANYSESIGNFSGYLIDWNVTTLGALLPPWWWSCQGKFNYAFGFTGSDGVTLWTNGQFFAEVMAIQPFGPKQQLAWGIQNQWFDYRDFRGGDVSGSGHWKIFISKNGSDAVVFQFKKLGLNLEELLLNNTGGWMLNTGLTGAGSVRNIAWDNDYVNFTLRVDPSWFDNVTVKLWVGWQGYPGFEATLTTTQYVGGAIPPLDELPVGPILPDDTAPFGFFTDLINFLTGAWGFIFGIITLIIGITIQVTPYLPFVAILYIIDLAITSFQHGSIQPIGYAFSMVWDIVVKAYDTIVNLAHLIWDAITFWN